MRVVTGLSLIAMALRFIAVPAYAQTQEELAEQARKHCNPVVPSSQVEGAFDLMLLLLVQVPPDDGVQSCMWQLSRITGPAGIVALHIQYSAQTFNSSSEAQKEFEETRKANPEALAVLDASDAIYLTPRGPNNRPISLVVYAVRGQKLISVSASVNDTPASSLTNAQAKQTLSFAKAILSRQ